MGRQKAGWVLWRSWFSWGGTLPVDRVLHRDVRTGCTVYRARHAARYTVQCAATKVIGRPSAREMPSLLSPPRQLLSYSADVKIGANWARTISCADRKPRRAASASRSWRCPGRSRMPNISERCRRSLDVHDFIRLEPVVGVAVSAMPAPFVV